MDRAIELLRGAERPAIMAGTGLYFGHGEQRAPGAGRGAWRSRLPQRARSWAACPPTIRSFFSRARSAGLKGADVALVIGVPMDFRLGFGGSFGEDTELIVVDAVARRAATPSTGRGGALRRHSGDAWSRCGRAPGREGASANGSPACASRRPSCAPPSRTSSNDPRAPLHPMRVYGELSQVLDRDAIVIGDGGDFVSYAGKMIQTYEPGCWMDPGPYGCLGAGPGIRPGRQDRAARAPGLPAARRRRLRLRRHGVRHVRPARASRWSA